MRLTVNNIRFVKVYTLYGITYQWYVAMKSNYVSDGRTYVNYYENGVTAVKEYPLESLPKTVQKFLELALVEEHFTVGDVRITKYTI